MDETETTQRDVPVALARLPVLMTTTIGRTQEIVDLVALLRQEDARLVTLTGPGGVGKTRLSLEVAQALREDFCDGVFFVSLAPLRELGQVLQAIAGALGIEETGGHIPEKRLYEYLSNKRCLLLLDNFEHILTAAKLTADLLMYAPRLKILISSREMLHIYGEREIIVSPLALPDVSEPEGMGENPAVELFVERARAIKAGFELNGENWRAIAEICVQLDGLPLAIELAAARCKILPPQVILARLHNRLSLLTGGARNLPHRQQTLRNTLDWSYDLLSKEEQSFFRGLGVFLGSWTFEAAAALADDDELYLLHMLTSLVDKSLVRLVEDTPAEIRFLLLETIREYALEALEQEGEREKICRRHAAFYCQLAEGVSESLHGTGQQEGLQCLDREATNLRAALLWAIEHNEVDLALRLTCALREYLPLRSLSGEGHQWFEDVLNLEGAQEASSLRARVLYGSGTQELMRSNLDLARQRLMQCQRVAREVDDHHMLALSLGKQAQLELYPGNYSTAHGLVEEGLQVANGIEDKWHRGILHCISGNIASKQGDFGSAQTRYALSLMLLREVGDRRKQAETLVSQSNMMRLRGKLRTAHYLYEKSLQLFQEIGDRWGQLACLNCMGEALWVQGSFVQARSCFEESIKLATLLGDRAERVMALAGLGQIALCLDERAQAARYLKEALHLAREINHAQGLSIALAGLGDLEAIQSDWGSAVLYFEQGLEIVKASGDKLMLIRLLSGLGNAARGQERYTLACAHLKQSLYQAWEIGNHVALTSGLEALAWLCVQINQPEHGALLLGAASNLRETLQTPLPPAYQTIYERDLAALKAAIGQEAFSECWSEGRALLLKQVMAISVARIHISEKPLYVRERLTAAPYNLTARELDVLRLLAEGYPDARIARLLVVSPRTINTHLRSVYAKLGVSSRSAATRVALEQKLV